MEVRGVFSPLLLALRVGTCWSRNSGSIKKKSTECVLFFVFFSAFVDWRAWPYLQERCGAAPACVRPPSRTRGPGWPISRARGFRASALTSLNKESAFGLETHVVSSKITDKYWKNTFDVSKFAKNVKQIDASDVTRNITINGNSKSNIINVGTGNNTIFGGVGNDSIYGGDGSNVFVYNKGDGNDRIYNFGNSDKLSITSGTVNVTANGNDVVFTVDKGKITLVGAVNREINYIENGNLRTTLFSGVNSDDLIVDDDFIDSDNQLSAIIRDGVANSYSTTRFDDKFTFTAEKSSLPALTYSGKKN